MRGRSVVIFFIMFFLIGFASLWADSATVAGRGGLTIEELAFRAALNNNSIKQAARSLNQAERNLDGPLELDRSSISVSGDYGYAGADGTDGEDLSHSFSLKTTASVPIIPQVQLGGSVTVPLIEEAQTGPSVAGPSGTNGSVQLSLAPFAQFQDTSKTEAAYTKSYTAFRYLERDLIYSIESAVLDFIAAYKEKEYKAEKLTLEEDRYETVKLEYDFGEATISEVSDVYDDLTGARQDYFTTERQLLSAEKNMIQILGEKETSIIIADVFQDELNTIVEQLSLIHI